ncbi:MAG TPA: hypothetical protein VFP21_04325 [Solirubrobacterales bacterium]|nr:hypothetical protein [Solirubrobacterales bacterium]
MAFLSDLLGYGVEVDWRLMWFPVREGAYLKAVEVRTASISLDRSDLPPPHGGFIRSSGYDLGQGEGDGDRLGYQDNPVVALLEIGTGAGSYVEAGVELRLGTAHTRTTISIEPSARTPFMLSLQGPRGGYLVNTAAVVDGVFNAGGRIKLSDLAKLVR